MKKNIISFLSVFVLALFAISCDTDIKPDNEETEEVQTDNTGPLKLIDQQLYEYDGDEITEYTGSGRIEFHYGVKEEVLIGTEFENGKFTLIIPEPDLDTLQDAFFELADFFWLEPGDLPEGFPDNILVAELYLSIKKTYFSEENENFSYWPIFRTEGSMNDIDTGGSFAYEQIIYSNSSIQIPGFTVVLDQYNEKIIVESMHIKKGWNRVIIKDYLEEGEDEEDELFCTSFKIDPDFQGKWTFGRMII